MKKIALILLSVLLIFSLCACGEKKPSTDKNAENNTENAETQTASAQEQLVSEFLKNVTVEEAPKAETAKDDTPMAELFEIPYQYDLTPYIEIEKSDYTGIELTKMSAEVTQKAMMEAIDADLANYGEETDVTDRGAEYGDSLNINFKGFESGVAFEGGTAENYEMVLGEAGFIDGFEEQLVGHKVGEEFTIDVVFPENYAENLAGKPAQFEIKINSIKVKSAVELTDEFVKENFFCETINDYLLQKYKEINEQNLAEVDNARKSLAYSTVYENVTIKKLPEDRYQLYADQITDDIKQTAEMYGMEFESFITQSGMTMEEFNNYVDEQATAIVEQELVAFAIANAEGLLAPLTKTDYNEYVAQLAASYGTDAETFESQYPTDMIWNSLVLEEAIVYVVDNATVKE